MSHLNYLDHPVFVEKGSIQTSGTYCVLSVPCHLSCIHSCIVYSCLKVAKKNYSFNIL